MLCIKSSPLILKHLKNALCENCVVLIQSNAKWHLTVAFDQRLTILSLGDINFSNSYQLIAGNFLRISILSICIPSVFRELVPYTEKDNNDCISSTHSPINETKKSYHTLNIYICSLWWMFRISSTEYKIICRNMSWMRNTNNRVICSSKNRGQKNHHATHYRQLCWRHNDKIFYKTSQLPITVNECVS